MSHPVDLPQVVVAKASAAGDAGLRWLDQLPQVVRDLETAWGIRTVAALPGGTAALVLAAATATGEPAVLRVPVPSSGNARQVRALVAARGQGHVVVLAHDRQHDAVLLEALGPSLDRCGLTAERQLAVLGDLLPRAWRTPRYGGAEPDEPPQDKSAGLASFVTALANQVDDPACDQLVEHALSCADRRSRAFDPGAALVVHGDAAPPNVLQAPTSRAGAETGFVLVDPDGFTGDPEYDLGVALRDWCPQLLADARPHALLRGYCQVLADRSGRDSTAIWEWGFLERVSTGLYVRSLGAEELARPFLRSAQALLDDAG